MSGESDPTNIAAPSGSITQNSAIITWTPSTGTGLYQAFGYKLRIYTGPQVYGPNLITQYDIPGGSTSSYHLTTLSPNTTYTVWLIGCASSMNVCSRAGTVFDHEILTFTTLAATPPVNCQGTWSDCDCTTGLDTYHITTQANITGTPCTEVEGKTRACDIPCGTPASGPCIGSWGKCSQDCGKGSQVYTYVSGDCSGLSTGDHQPCNDISCDPSGPVIDCVGLWSVCDNGLQTYSIKTPMSNGGKPCEYTDTDTQTCTDYNTDYDVPDEPPWLLIMGLMLLLVVLGIVAVWIKVP